MTIPPYTQQSRQAGQRSSSPRRGLVHPPEALTHLARGFEQMARPLAQTLGPSPRLVIHTPIPNELEFLTNSATIARRIIELPDRRENVGAMALRGMMQKMHERYGDGTATAAVLSQAMVQEGIKLLAAGFSPPLLKRGMEQGLHAAQRALAEQAQPIRGEEMLTRLACGVTGNRELSAILGEVFDTLGESTSVFTEYHPRPCLDREYVSGGQWAAAPGASLLIPDGKSALELQQPLIFLNDDNLETVEQVQPALEQAAAFPGKPPLLVVARHVLGQALNALTINHTRGILTVGIALLKTGVEFITDDLEDMALMTGGQVMARATGQPAERMKPAYFGRARKATLTRTNLLIVDGAGDPRKIRERIIQVREQIKRLPRGEQDWHKKRLRVGRLSGGVGVVKIGASNEHERELLKEQVEKAALVLDTAMEEGVVPGGGVAYLNCISAVEEASKGCTDRDEAAGMRLVAQTLAAPFLQIVRNHGQFPPSLILDEVRRQGPGSGFDAQTGECTSMAERGILDSLAVTRAALEAAVSTAAMVLTIDAVILREW
jgi:chaperonin GroEL